MRRVLIAAAALALTGCQPQSRTQFAQVCIDRGHNPTECTDAAERLFPKGQR